MCGTCAAGAQSEQCVAAKEKQQEKDARGTDSDAGSDIQNREPEAKSEEKAKPKKITEERSHPKSDTEQGTSEPEQESRGSHDGSDNSDSVSRRVSC